MQKMVREALPPDIRIAGDAFDLIVECCTGAPVAARPCHALLVPWEMASQGSCWADAVAGCAEFVQLVSSEASEVSDQEKKTTITPEHVLAALQQLGFSDFQEDLQAFYGDVKESNAQQGNSPPAVALLASAGRVPQLLHTDVPLRTSAVTPACTFAATPRWSLTHRALQASRGEGAGRLAPRRVACPRKSRRGLPSRQCRMCGHC